MNFFRKKKKEPKPVIMTDNSIIRRHYRFTGIVQGVGFRVEVWKRAVDLGLVGWVKNNYDGSVECELQGSQEKMDHLVASMKKIPRIHLESISVHQIPLKQESGFEMMGY